MYICRMTEKVIIVDFGSQYTQLIARRVREHHVYSEIQPCFDKIVLDDTVKAVILSGSPMSVKNFEVDLNFEDFLGKVPVLAICFGAQLLAEHYGGRVERSSKREYGKANLHVTNDDALIFKNLADDKQIWMSHADTILKLPDDYEIIGNTSSIPVAAFQSKPNVYDQPVYGLQFHPEVTHSLKGKQIIKNFLLEVANCHGQWTAASFVQESIEKVKNEVGNGKVLMGLSGGVDSTVCASILNEAIGENLYSFFIDNGLLRKDEYQEVLDAYHRMGLNVIGIDAKDEFLSELIGVSDPEEKRKIIGRVFIEVFQREAAKIEGINWLAQGTIYPDVIESVSVKGPSATIKSHHNVGGLPASLHLNLVEPLRNLFKDEVREAGHELGVPDEILHRHPFPGPGLAIRVLGEITEERLNILQESDAIYIQGLKDHGLYDNIWQAGAILLPVQSVGVMGDERTYEWTIALRAVNSTDGMTAEWSRLPYDFMAEMSTTIINQVKGVNRVVYDISTKPPATIEWE
jgi:GMP synthase (glutamine-hydrolysing)